MKVVWYDDIDFPSGAAGKRMKAIFPNDVRKILSKLDTAVAANTTVALTLPKGTLLAAVAMNTQTKERQDLTPSVSDGKLTWKAPADNWKLMLFTCDTWDSNTSNDIVVDYLDPQAIDKYFTLNHQEFEKRLKPYFGTTIKQIYIDDIGFYTGGKHGEKRGLPVSMKNLNPISVKILLRITPLYGKILVLKPKPQESLFMTPVLNF